MFVTVYFLSVNGVMHRENKIFYGVEWIYKYVSNVENQPKKQMEQNNWNE